MQLQFLRKLGNGSGDLAAVVSTSQTGDALLELAPISAQLQVCTAVFRVLYLILSSVNNVLILAHITHPPAQGKGGSLSATAAASRRHSMHVVASAFKTCFRVCHAAGRGQQRAGAMLTWPWRSRP